MRRAFLFINLLMILGIVLQKASLSEKQPVVALQSPTFQAISSSPSAEPAKSPVTAPGKDSHLIANNKSPVLPKKSPSFFSRIFQKIKRACVSASDLRIG